MNNKDLPYKLQPEGLHGGFVELIDYSGSDQRILQAARVSTGSSPSKGEDADRGLIRYLYKNQHLSPFEQCSFTFHIKLPIFCFRQMVRHRTWKFNEYSMRYSEPIKDLFLPTEEEWREQGTTNHQGSGGLLSKILGRVNSGYALQTFSEIQNSYNKLLENGVAREQARIVIPVAQFTEIYASVDLRNLFHFLELRLHHLAQKEIRDYAELILFIVNSLEDFKWSIEIFDEMRHLNYSLLHLLESKVEPKQLTKYLMCYGRG